MTDETEARPPGTPEGRGHPGGDPGEQSPLQARAEFIKNRSWDSVVGFNRGACARGGTEHGLNPETGSACAAEWEKARGEEVTFLEFLDFLKEFHRRAPFLFFNGNTFADVARQVSAAIFAELPPLRRREMLSAIAHYVAGVLDRDAMIAAVDSLWRRARMSAGDRVRTLRGSMRGVIVRVLDDGRLAWRPDGQAGELVALPESLRPDL
jgi:hypothetical protein